METEILFIFGGSFQRVGILVQGECAVSGLPNERKAAAASLYQMSSSSSIAVNMKDPLALLPLLADIGVL
jgi:hypothetical protein